MKINRAVAALILELVGACGSAVSRLPSAKGGVFWTLAILTTLATPGWTLDRAAVHGMLLFGENRLYFSHLPMFHSPHDYQVILEIELSGNGADPKSVYLKDKEATRTKIYTFVPRPFVLPEIVQKQSPITGDIYRGHFERGGEVISRGVSAKIIRVVHFRKFVPGAARPVQSKYLLFGAAPELFMAHLISSPPNFDQVLSVSASSALSEEETLSGEFAAFREQSDNDPLASGIVVWTQLRGGHTAIETGVQWYFETEDLKQ